MSGTRSASADEGLLGRALRLVWPVALVLLGALVLASAWHAWTVSLLFAVVAAVPLLVLRGALRVGMSRWFASSMILLLALMGAYLATTGADLSLEQTVQDVVPRLLTAPQPYAVKADLLVGPLLLTALVSVLVGLRVDSRLRVEPVAGAAVLYLAGMLLTAGTADPAGLVAVLVLVVALLGWVFLDEHGEPVRQRLALAGPVSVVGVGALAAIATLPVGAAFEPRETVDPPVVQVAASNPLTQLGAWANNPTVDLLRVRGPEVPLRLVVLDEYDGTQWTSATRFEQVRSDGRTGLEPGPFPSASTLQVEFAKLGGSWLPSPGTPLSVALDDALVDPGTGTLYTPGDTQGLVYEVSGAYDAPPANTLDAAQVSADDLDDLTALPPLPEPLADFAGRVGADAATPYARASAIERLVREKYELSPTAISGSAIWRVDQFLLGGKDKPGGGVGTSEQFATAFAVLARYNGLPTRVVVGFRPGAPQEDGTRVVRGEDAFAWAEVYFRDLGWVPFSPTPDDDTFVRPRPIEATEADLPEEAETGTPVLPTPTTQTPTDEATPGDDTAAPVGGDRFEGPSAPLLVGTALGLVLVLLVLLRTGRRVAHARRGPAGAWAEVTDALRLSGLRPAPHQPADVVAAGLDARLGTRAAAIAARAERATFAPPDAAPSGPSTDRAELRTQVRDVRRRVRRETPLWRRWWWYLDPRVLRG